MEQKWEELKALEEQDEKNLTPEGKEALEQLMDKYEPALVILDPFYLMFDGDIKSLWL